ncbi:hypothetical protein LTR36_004839 [Oleoguttula mirabilis]|uniref:Uncharacterized protein n=1 Tax=Oleoguttula mirabilis TaxID=1507867 RepID=A0AAV9JF33_9PEZI|nr:hypothetical protein LTR36_004839 [Oleoguttula mirabilis]
MRGDADDKACWQEAVRKLEADVPNVISKKPKRKKAAERKAEKKPERMAEREAEKKAEKKAAAGSAARGSILEKDEEGDLSIAMRYASAFMAFVQVHDDNFGDK